MNSFADLELIEPLQRAVAHEGYEHPTPIQAQAIPLLLEGRDVLGCAQTGTGKTAAFALPLLQHLSERPSPAGKRRIRALVLTPTRELAAQIDESFAAYGRYLDIRHTVIFGGVNQKSQVEILRRGVDVLVATPGRLLDLIGQGHIDLGDVAFFVLDEADRMLDMGFIHDVKRVLKVLPGGGQNLLFSATMPRTIEELGSAFLNDPAWVEVSPEAKTVDQIEQRLMFVARADKRRLLAELLRSPEVERVLVFTRTKHGANRLVKQLDRAGISAAAIHGNKSQNARRVALSDFREGDNRVLVATDLAARGIDVEGISHVFNFDLPNEPETYVHRIGRTGRAGNDGIAISFCDETEGEYLRDIEKLIGFELEVETDQPYHHAAAEPPPHRKPLPRGAARRPRRAAPVVSKPRADRPPRRESAHRRAHEKAPEETPPPAAEAAAPPRTVGEEAGEGSKRKRRRGKKSAESSPEPGGESETRSRREAESEPRAPKQRTQSKPRDKSGGEMNGNREPNGNRAAEEHAREVDGNRLAYGGPTSDGSSITQFFLREEGHDQSEIDRPPPKREANGNRGQARKRRRKASRPNGNGGNSANPPSGQQQRRRRRRKRSGRGSKQG